MSKCCEYVYCIYLYIVYCISRSLWIDLSNLSISMSISISLHLHKPMCLHKMDLWGKTTALTNQNYCLELPKSHRETRSCSSAPEALHPQWPWKDPMVSVLLEYMHMDMYIHIYIYICKHHSIYIYTYVNTIVSIYIYRYIHIFVGVACTYMYTMHYRSLQYIIYKVVLHGLKWTHSPTHWLIWVEETQPLTLA